MIEGNPMANILIVYGSTTGNTEMVAKIIMEQLTSHKPVMQDVADTSPEDLTKYMVYGTGCCNKSSLYKDEKDLKLAMEEAVHDDEWIGDIIGYKMTPIFSAKPAVKFLKIEQPIKKKAKAKKAVAKKK